MGYELVEAEIDKLVQTDDFKKSYVVEQTYRHYRDNDNYNPANSRGKYERALRQATREMWDFLHECKIRPDKPKVLKKGSSKSWRTKVCEHMRLTIVQTGTVKNGKIEFSIEGENYFNRWQETYDHHNRTSSGHPTKVIVPTNLLSHFSKVSFYDIAGSMPHGTPVPDPKEVIRVLNEQAAEKLDTLHHEWKVVWSKTLDDAPKIIEEFTGKRSSAESSKFREKLQKFLKENQKLMEIDPDFMVACMQMDPGDLEALSNFMRRNRADIAFVCREDFELSQKEAQVSGVMES